MDERGGKQGAGFRGALRHREFRVLWTAGMQSQLGDQLARVALVVLVYDRTGSGVGTAAVYALTFLPELLGSLLLGPIADRLPVRRLLVVGDLARCCLLAGMAVPGMPVAALAVLLVAAVLIGTPWKAAESALVAVVLEGEHYVVGTGLRTATAQSTQLLGFALGGAVVAAVGSRVALGIDAATFAISALILGRGLQWRPAAQAGAEASQHPAARGRWFEGVASVFRDRTLRRLLALVWLLGLLVLPEGLAVPYAAGIGGGSAAVGVLLAAMPAGLLIGSLLYSRWADATTRAALAGPLAGLAGVPLIGCLWHPGLAASVLLWGLSGACTAYHIQVVAEFVRAVQPAVRGQAISFAAGTLMGAQGLGMLIGGALLGALEPETTVAVAGLAASLVGCVLAVGRRRGTAIPARPAATPSP